MKIGFACKIYDESKEVEKQYNFSTTTLAYLSKLPNTAVREKLNTLAHTNLDRLTNLLTYVSNLPPTLRMLRLSGDIIPFYTHPISTGVYHIPDLETRLAAAGSFAREHDIRLSFHPGQYTLLGTANDNVAQNSIQDLEYHTWLLLAMGYSGWHDHGCCINIHVGSNKVPGYTIRSRIKSLSSPCRDFLTLENDEFCYGLYSIIHHYSDLVAVVPDLHHVWVKSGLLIQSNSGHVDGAIASWRGVRPKMHVSMSPEDYLRKNMLNNPVMLTSEDWGQALPKQPYLVGTKTELRKHSDTIWYDPMVDYFGQFIGDFDLMVEAKHKQRAASDLYQKFIDRGLIVETTA